MSRELLILVGEDDFLAYQLNYNLLLKSAVWIGDVSPHFTSQSSFPFSKTKNLLGSEFPAIIMMRAKAFTWMPSPLRQARCRTVVSYYCC